ncbi:sugar ABC transporter permease [Paenibacillus sp. YN15]|nr:sugar ABC transporter permease [Paenibacillus sp. YN15]
MYRKRDYNLKSNVTIPAPLNGTRQKGKSLLKRNSLLREYVKHKYLFLLLLPLLVYYAVFHYAPMYGIMLAFKDFYPLKGIAGSPWVGLEHFTMLFTGLDFLPVLKNTLIISFYKLFFGFPAPIILCLIINEVRHTFFKKAVQTVTYLPHFISWVVLAGFLIELLSPSRGPINILLQLLGIDPIFFIADVNWFRGVIVASSIWREVGWQSIIYLAAVAGINTELYDVANMDGAGRLQRIWYITIPSITPVIIIMFIFATGSIIQDDFDQIYNLLNAKVLSVGDVISTYTYREGLVNMNFGYATAVGLFKNVVAFTLVMNANFIARKFSNYAIL